MDHLPDESSEQAQPSPEQDDSAQRQAAERRADDAMSETSAASAARTRAQKQLDGKPPLDELPWLALAEVATAIRAGQRQHGYERHNWRAPDTTLSQSDLLAAAMRHLVAHLYGEIRDSSGAYHLACGAFNVLVALELLLLKRGKDGRDPTLTECPPHRQDAEPAAADRTLGTRPNEVALELLEALGAKPDETVVDAAKRVALERTVMQLRLEERTAEAADPAVTIVESGYAHAKDLRGFCAGECLLTSGTWVPFYEPRAQLHEDWVAAVWQYQPSGGTDRGRCGVWVRGVRNHYVVPDWAAAKAQVETLLQQAAITHGKW